MRSRPLYDVVALLARLGVGAVFVAHGWQKIEVGVTATGRWFEELGVPFPTGAAVYATFVELLGGTLLIAGVGLPVVGALLFVDMLGALVFVHAGNGLFVVNETGTAALNGYELVVVLGVASLLLAVGDGGRLSVQHFLLDGGGSGRPRGLRRSRRTRDEEEDDGQSFVDALRAAEEEAPAPALEKPKRSSSKSGGKSGAGGSAPTLPEAAARPSSSSSSPGQQDARLASDIVSGTRGTEDDTLVAGRRKSSRRRRSDTQPMKRNTGGDASS
ncbi:hypothetical protein Acsp03_32460 [Actinomadura sp. NBRC 104412]|uniref:DoxX family protein n=1 Tax=Actinomadura sp. NBRC 104412 TaxID=3032203 RepID=UPI0024A07092|nr:DoxX family protein [Actinomadura sp. NBRC 104412]GLZ05780.1 hypothetical protein Acsp03_32460 [Actinomadura sp. NBRC 104412]